VSNDLAIVGIQGHMQLAPLAAGFGTMLFSQALAGTVDLQAGAVDQHMQWTARQCRSVIQSD
jgi:hypothetical protein